MKKQFMACVLCLVSVAVLMAVAGGDWLAEVPARDREKANPLRGQPQATQAGRLLFADHCAQCHGENAQGTKKRPSLRTTRIQSQASEGALHWLLVNGDVRHGMPSWSRLPDQQLWQIVTYLRSLRFRE